MGYDYIENGVIVGKKIIENEVNVQKYPEYDSAIMNSTNLC